jgi:hypothetical protein
MRNNRRLQLLDVEDGHASDSVSVQRYRRTLREIE